MMDIYKVRARESDSERDRERDREREKERKILKERKRGREGYEHVEKTKAPKHRKFKMSDHTLLGFLFSYTHTNAPQMSKQSILL